MHTPDLATADCAGDFVDLVSSQVWGERIGELARVTNAGSRLARTLTQRHAIEISLERMRRRGRNTPPTELELLLGRLACEITAMSATLTEAGRERLRTAIAAALDGEATLVGLFHLASVASRQRHRGFEIDYSGFDEASPFDLMLRRDGVEAELVTDVVSAEDGRDVRRGAWVQLVDRVDPDLQTWLADHPGRYLLKMTLPQGLREQACAQGADPLALLHGRIRAMLHTQCRGDHDEAAVLRLDPLMLAGSQADELGLMNRLRREFGHEAHLAVTASGGGVFVMAARAAREDEVAGAIRRRMSALAPTRLTGTRPGILAMLIEDTDRLEWRHLRDRLVLEGEARQFLTHPEARRVVAVTCASRLELFGLAGPDVVADGELRFRNPQHPASKLAALAPAVASSV